MNPNVEKALLEMYYRRGVLVPEEVVGEAQSEDSVFHPYFEWNDSVAAIEHRIEQARGLIRRVKITVIYAEQEYKVNAYQPARYVGREAPGYLHINDVRDDTEGQKLLQRQMQRDFVHMKRRYGHLSAFWSLLQSEVDEVE